MITVWAAVTPLREEKGHCLMFSGQRAGFLGQPSAVLMCDWQTALGFAAKSPRTLEANTPFGTLWAALCPRNRCISAAGNDLIPRVL